MLYINNLARLEKRELKPLQLSAAAQEAVQKRRAADTAANPASAIPPNVGQGQAAVTVILIIETIAAS